MITVRLFGIIRLQTKIANLKLEASDINELLKKVSLETGGTRIETLKNSVIYVNGRNITDLNFFRTKLKDNDEVQILSPIAGG